VLWEVRLAEAELVRKATDSPAAETHAHKGGRVGWEALLDDEGGREGRRDEE